MANKIYSAFENTLYFQPTAPSASGVEFSSILSLPNNSGAISVPRDFGNNSHATIFRWKAKTKCTTEGYLGGHLDLYWSTSDTPSGPFDGNMASGDSKFTNTNANRNFQWIGAIQVDNSGVAGPYVTSGLTKIYGRFAALAVINKTGDTLSGTAADHSFTLTPIPDEVQ